jgi:hypothetical protein
MVDGGVEVSNSAVPVPSFAALYRDGGGAPGAFLGASVLVPPNQSQLLIPVKEPEAGWVVFHADTNGNGSFDLGRDRPVTDLSTGSAITLKVAE